MAEYQLRLTDPVIELLDNGIICQGKDGLTKIRDARAFKNKPFKQGDVVSILIKNIVNQKLYDALLKHPTKTWMERDNIKFAGVINTIGFGAFDLKELKADESPFLSKWFYDERSWLSNDKYFDDLPKAHGDTILVEIKKFKKL